MSRRPPKRPQKTHPKKGKLHTKTRPSRKRQPTKRRKQKQLWPLLKEWFSVLPHGGWLAITYPVHGSFPEWHNAAIKANVNCTALPLPNHHSLLNVLKKEKILFNKLETYIQEGQGVTSLLKQFVKFGAQTTPHESLKISQWRKLQKSWSIPTRARHPQLTWLIQILLAQK